jgi:hypothetical protein
MPIDFHVFQLILAGSMIAGLLLFVAPLMWLTRRSRLPTASAVAILLPIVGLVWLWLLASGMRPDQPDRTERDA